MQTPVHDGVEHLIEAHPGGHELGLLGLTRGPPLLGQQTQVLGEEDPGPLGGEAGRGVELGQRVPSGRDVVRLLSELAGGGDGGGLPRHVEQAGGNLPQTGAYGMTVLADHEDLRGAVGLRGVLTLAQGDDGDGVVVDDDLTGHRILAGGEAHVVGVDGEDRPAPDPLTGDQLPSRLAYVDEPARVTHDVAILGGPAVRPIHV